MRGLLSVFVSFAAISCSFSDEDGVDGPLGGSRTVEGSVVDFETGMPISGAASISTSGLSPVPKVTSQGASFTITGVPENSAFQILASAPATHRPTFSDAVVVEDDDLRDVKVPAVSEAFLGTLATGFGVSPSAAKGVLLARVVDDRGMPKAGVAAGNFVLAGGVTATPRFLGANMLPAPAATATSASGWVVFFELAPGVVSLGQSAGATVTLDMAVAPVSAGTVTIGRIIATDGAVVLPKNVSFRSQVVPIFGPKANGGRGCEACHSGNGTGRDLGGLTLDGSANLIYKELVEERPGRVVIAMPETSLLLRMPSREDPPDRHPNITFTSQLDPDYLKLLIWIREGAKDN
jgi:hypothetical protein